jgi:hypothetical protein
MKEMKVKGRKVLGMLLAGAILFWAVVLCASIASSAAQQREEQARMDAVRSCAEAMRPVLRDLLKEEGLKNAGLMVSYIYEDGEATYQVQVHHREIGQMSAEENEALISGIRTTAADCIVRLDAAGRETPGDVIRVVLN